MEKERVIKRLSSDELADRRARGESQTDFARVHAKTETERQRDIAGDPDFRKVPANWYEAATAVMPTTKQLLSLLLDTDVVDWFRSQGVGYQTRINAVLRIFVEQQSKSKQEV
jgi:uncharacterized protein (DUF4415 family)